MSDLISRNESITKLREYADQKHMGGNTELANGILSAVNFLEKESNIPTVSQNENIDGKYNVSLTKHELDLIWDALGILKERSAWAKEQDCIRNLRYKVDSSTHELVTRTANQIAEEQRKRVATEN